MKTDADLLRAYHERQDQSAFRELIERHGALVYGTALRRSGSAELAREISQNVFVLLAKNAGRLRDGTGLAGWLHRAAVLTSANATRQERRRALAMNRYASHLETLAADDRDLWTDALPRLDEALARLPDRDRDIIAAHFLEGRSYEEIAESRNSTKAAVQKRASRTIAKLASWLGVRRKALPVALLLAGLGSLRAESLPDGMAASLAAKSLAALPDFPLRSVWAFRCREAWKYRKLKLAGTALFAMVPLSICCGGFLLGRTLGLQTVAERVLAEDQRAADLQRPRLLQPASPPAKRSVRDIVDEAAAHYLDDSDPIGAARGEVVLEALAATDIPAALDCLGPQLAEAPIGLSMVPLLIGKWAPAISSDEAVRWVLAHVAQPQAKQAALPPALWAWAAHEAPAALAWLRGQPAVRKQFAPGALFPAVYNGFDEAQTDRLWAELPDLPTAEEDAALLRLTRDARDPALRETLLARVRGLEDERLRLTMCKMTAQMLALVDPDAAFAWAENLPLDDAQMRWEVRAKLLKHLSLTHPARCGALMVRDAPEAMKAQLIEGFINHIANPSKP